MSYNFTTDTQTIVINSNFRTSGDKIDAYIPMGNRLNPNFDFYHCKVLSVCLNSHNTVDARRNVCLEAFDFMEESYTNDEKYNSQPIINSLRAHPAQQYSKKQNMSYIVKNFNNKTIRFIITDLSNSREIAINIPGSRQWTLILALTPIYDNTYKLYKTISDKNNERFCYTVIGHSDDEIINLPPIYNSYNKFFVVVNECHITHLEVTSGSVEEYIIITAFDLADNPSNDSGEHVLAMCGDHEYAPGPFYDGNPNPINSTFIIQNMKQTRPTRFRILDQTFSVIDPARILAGFEYMIKFIITPIE